jgi:hypothetical protein
MPLVIAALMTRFAKEWFSSAMSWPFRSFAAILVASVACHQRRTFDTEADLA